MIVDIVPVGDPVLRKKSKPVHKFDKKLINLIIDLKETLLAQKDPEGVGLAAPQIGKNLQVFVMKPTKKDLVKIVINPEIINLQKSQKKSSPDILEGCLSLPHYYGPIRKSHSLTLKYLSPKINGDKITVQQVQEDFENFPAQVVLHEIDHLKGKLFIDNILKDQKPLYKIHSDGSWEEVELV